MAVTITEHDPSKNLRNFTVTINHTTHIHTAVTSHPGAARDWIHRTLHYLRRHRHHLVVGLGVQWTPFYFHHYHHQAATINLCIGQRCLIFQLIHSRTVPRILRRLLSDPANTFVGIWNGNDSKKLRESKHALEMERGMPIDVRLHVEGPDWVRDAAIGEIVEEVLGFDMGWDEEISKSEWEVEVEELSDDQVRQAAVDAYASFAIGVEIEAWKLNNNRG